MTREKGSSLQGLATVTTLLFLLLPKLYAESSNFVEESSVANGRQNEISQNLTSPQANFSGHGIDSAITDRTARALTLPINYGYDNMRKSDIPFDKNSSSGSLNPPSTDNGNERNLSSIDEATSLAFQKMINNKRPSFHRKYPAHYTLYRTVAEEHPNDKAPVRNYPIRDDNEYQSQNYESDYHPHKYDYEDNSIPEDQINYEEVLSDPWRVSYIDHNAGYYGPPHAPGHYDAQPHVLSLSPECSCPRQSFDCDPGLGSTFTSLLSALGRNLWALLRLTAAAVAPILIPLLAVKMVLVPIKVFTILKLLKLFIKFFIILPFFVRVLYPALTSSFSWSNFFAALQALMPGGGGFKPPRPLVKPLRPLAANDPLELTGDGAADDDDDDDELESRHDSSSDDDVSNGVKEEQESSAWDLRACPNRVACELGAFLSGSAKHSLPENLLVRLGRKARDGKDGLGDADDFLRKHEIFKAFLMALTDGWSLDKCQLYKCSVLF